MIDVRELRIGNWILAEVYLPSTEYHKLTGKDIYDIERGVVTVYFIKLTQELLEKCRISRDHLLGDFDVFDNGYLFYSNDELINIKPIEYLHQLQNLYFDLTGEELNIKL